LSDGQKKEIYRDVWFFHGAIQFTTGRTRSHGGVETTFDKTFLFWKPTTFKSRETQILSGGICFGLRSKNELNFALKHYVCGFVGLT